MNPDEMNIQSEGFLYEGPITANQISKFLSEFNSLNTGAFSIFLGQVRSDKIENKTVKEIEYSAYAEMVETEMNRIIHEVCTTFSEITFIRVLHSTGKVKAGEISLLVLVGSVHRKQAIKCCEEIVELIKAQLPVWKKEFFDDDSYIWTENKL